MKKIGSIIAVMLAVGWLYSHGGKQIGKTISNIDLVDIVFLGGARRGVKNSLEQSLAGESSTSDPGNETSPSYRATLEGPGSSPNVYSPEKTSELEKLENYLRKFK